LNEEELKELAGNLREKHCDMGELLFSENSPREDIFINL
jgi:hypothetical protein